MAGASGLNFRRLWHQQSILAQIINTKYGLCVTALLYWIMSTAHEKLFKHHYTQTSLVKIYIFFNNSELSDVRY